MDKQIWRSDSVTHGSVTETTVVIHSTDVYSFDSYSLVVCHVECTDGKGFMPSIRQEPNAIRRNGHPVVGETAEAYLKVVHNGLVLLRECQEKDALK